MSKGKEGCIAALIGLAVIPLAVMWKGFVLAKLWGWFLVDKFGLPALTIAQAIGLAIVVGMFSYIRAKDDEDEVWQPFVLAFLGPLVSLFAGWIVQHWT